MNVQSTLTLHVVSALSCENLLLPQLPSCNMRLCLHFTTPQAFVDRYKLMKTIGDLMPPPLLPPLSPLCL